MYVFWRNQPPYCDRGLELRPTMSTYTPTPRYCPRLPSHSVQPPGQRGDFAHASVKETVPSLFGQRSGRKGVCQPRPSWGGLGLKGSPQQAHCGAGLVQGSCPDRQIGDADNTSVILGLLCNLENKYLRNDPVLHLVKHRVCSHLELDKYPLRGSLKGTRSFGETHKRLLGDADVEINGVFSEKYEKKKKAVYSLDHVANRIQQIYKAVKWLSCDTLF